MNQNLTRFAITMAVAKVARQITTDALIHGVLLDYNAVALASQEFKNGKIKLNLENSDNI